MVLDPTEKWAYFEKRWKPEWVVNAKETMQKLWQSYSNMSVAPARFVVPEETHATKFMAWMNDGDDLVPSDELEQYVNEPRIKRISNGHKIDVTAWWLEQRNRLPTLARMALNILCIPAMSSEAERVFS